MQISPSWLAQCGIVGLETILLEYGYFVHRFTQFIGLVIGHAEDADVRRLLLPNLIDEIGNEGGDTAHVTLYSRCASSCNVALEMDSISPMTKEIEDWFFTVFNSSDTVRSLAVLGPGTDEIAQSFLVPLELSLMKAFPSVDLGYFEVHRPEMEANHINDIRQAIRVLRDKFPAENVSAFDERINKHAQEAVAMHARFWDNMQKLALNAI